MQFIVWNEDKGEDNAVTIDAGDAEEAAESWAEQDDWKSAEYAICAGRSTPTVSVRDPDGKVARFKVEGETVPSYRVDEIECGDSPA